MAFNNTTAPPVRLPPKPCSNFFLCQDWYRSRFHEATVANAVVNIPLSLIAVLGNALVFAAYHQSESLRRPVFSILMFVALIDFLTGAISQPLFTFVLLKTLNSCPQWICKVDLFANIFVLFSLGATLLNLTVITIDRYIAVFYTYRYEEIVTNSRVKKLCIILWLSWFVVIIGSTPWVFGMMLRRVGVTVNHILGFTMSVNIILISLLYSRILWEIRRLQSNVAVPANQPQETKKAQERKTAVTTGYILGALLVCFVPMVYSIFLLPLFQNNPPSLEERLDRRFPFLIATSCYLSNSSLNVFIYAWKNKEMKTAMVKVLRLLKEKIRGE